jgi:hypothetical protein
LTADRVTPRRRAILGLALPIMLATLPASAAPAAPVEELPVPPIPPDDAPTDLPAPVPDATVQAPNAPVQEGPTLRPTLNAHAPTLPGGDPVPGTLYRSEEEQRRQFIPNPGIQLVVPLQK